MNRSLRKPDRRLGFPLRPFTNQPLPVLLPRTSKAYMGRFSETWQHPGIYNLIDRSSNLLSTCSRVLILPLYAKLMRELLRRTQ